MMWLVMLLFQSVVWCGNRQLSCCQIQCPLCVLMLLFNGVVWEETIILLPDNVHYVFYVAISERGVVWEETIVLLPDNVHYVFYVAISERGVGRDDRPTARQCPLCVLMLLFQSVVWCGKRRSSYCQTMSTMCSDVAISERGVVWEETIVLLPDNVHYVFSCCYFRAWCGVGRDDHPAARQCPLCVLISHYPQCHTVCWVDLPSTQTGMKGQFHLKLHGG